ncbi:MAG: Glu-tRNA(Gln) amidotransferase subunit GatD [Chloroherpetonaceae bacterium]|jgi:glutamyl-tRNA(Gln) amidotransferase subunit D|nr:Glu-tRNA(Gln) amidotransferase subunit GatD [bacterium]
MEEIASNNIVTEDKELYKGYRSKALEVLKKYNAYIWSDIDLVTDEHTFQGIILPRSETSDEFHIVLKLESGYNIGILWNKVKDIKIKGRKEAHYLIPEKEFPYSPKMPRVKLFGTGGTIASRLDYRTGAVIPAFSPGELYGSVPELADICNLETEKLYGVFSENMGPEQWIGTAKAIAKEIERGVDGIVIGHGTDTMHHTAAILSYMIQDSPIPIVMVGSQRSSDRPSSDAAYNLIHSVKAAAESDIAEVMVCMFGPTSDMYGLLHQGTRVRKMHSSYRSTFRTIGDIPIAMINREKITPLRTDYRKRREDKNFKLAPYFDDRVSIVYYYPNMKPDIIDSLIDNGYLGIIIAGTGLGHVNKPLYPALKRAQDKGIAVFMNVQTLWGYAQMYVYDTGRDLMELGVTPLANMLPEVAYVKLGWVLGQTHNIDEVKKMMLTPIAHDITEREPSNGYLIFQGGIPEVEEFISKIKK